MPTQKHVALFLKSLNAGGMQTSLLRLAGGLADRGLRVDVIVAGKLNGPIREAVPHNVRLISLSKSRLPWISLWQALRSFQKDRNHTDKPIPLPFVPPRGVRYLPAVIRYLARERPDSMIVAGTVYNLVALWARKLSGLPMRVVVSERNSISAEISLPENQDEWHWRHARQMVASTYPAADAIVANSEGVSADLSASTGLPRASIKTIYNPIVSEALDEQALEHVDHPWFLPDAPPVILGVGRLHPQKDFATLIRAFARVRAERHVRLVVLGKDVDHGVRDELMALAKSLGVSDDVDLPGFSVNPYSFMANAAVFVLSSKYEGCPNVLVEALACGCPVVSTRCPHGPDEILIDGKFGALVDVGDDEAMADAINATLENPPCQEILYSRAAQFDFNSSVVKYLKCI